MVIVIKTGTPEAAIRQLLAQLAAQNVKGGCVAGPDGILLPLVGDTWRLDPNMLQGLPYVQEVRRLTPAYRLAGRAAHPANTVVAVGDAKIGEKFCMIAGPCAVESAPQMAAVAQSVKESGAQLLRGGAFKPRTSPYTFQGLEKAGLDLLVQAGRDAGLPVVTEITDISQLDLLADVDVLQVGARNMQNYALLKALGQLRRPVLLKRGLSATVEEFLLAAEYLLSGGNEQVILCERGVRSGVSAARAALDVSAIPVLKRATHLPVLVDPSHAAGRSELVLPLALAAAAAGADGLMVEVHDRPACALSDGGPAVSSGSCLPPSPPSSPTPGGLTRSKHSPPHQAMFLSQKVGTPRRRTQRAPAKRANRHAAIPLAAQRHFLGARLTPAKPKHRKALEGPLPTSVPYECPMPRQHTCSG